MATICGHDNEQALGAMLVLMYGSDLYESNARGQIRTSALWPLEKFALIRITYARAREEGNCDGFQTPTYACIHQTTFKH